MTKQTINRRSDVVTRVEGDETLVLDTQSNTAHCLSGDVAVVWNAAGSSVAAVAAAAGLSPEAVASAVATLDDLGLVAAPAGLSRRTLVTRGAMVGGAVVAAGAISIPLPAAAGTISQDGFVVTGTCAGDFATFRIEPVGSKGVLASLHTYHATLVYESWTGTAITYKTVTFDVQVNGSKIQTGGGTSGGTDSGATTTVSPGGSNGHVDVVTTTPFAGIYPLPTTLPDPVPPTGDGFGGGTTSAHGGISGNVYLQFVPDISTDPYWWGYFNLTGCVTFQPGSQPPIAWPPPTT